jgi:hypothetical protein
MFFKLNTVIHAEGDTDAQKGTLVSILPGPGPKYILFIRCTRLKKRPSVKECDC